MSINLRRTENADLEFVISAEHSAENSPFISPWTREQHVAAITSEDFAHLVAESMPNDRRVGYIILAGLAEANRSIELRRIVVTEKSRGYGREALRLVKRLTFEELGAHRLWLDVKEHNVRARHLYESEGFVFEGTLRECLKAETGFDSLVVMSMLRDEYDANARQIPCQEVTAGLKT